MTWHENCNDFNSRIEASAKNDNFNDTVFLLTQSRSGSSQPDAENPDGDKVAANKAILALISPVFYAQFYGPLATPNDGPIEIVDGTAEGFKQLIDFICHPNTFELDVDHVAEVFDISYFAHKYQIQSLISYCRQYLGNMDLESKELDSLNWAVSSERGLEMKAAFPIEHALVVHNCWDQIEEEFKNMFPNGKLKEDEDLPDEALMIKILGRGSKLFKPELVLSVALDYYCKLMEKSQKIVKGRKRLKMNDEKEWDKKLDKIKSVVQLQNVRPKKLADIYEKFFKKIPDSIMGKITKEMSSTWKNIDKFNFPRLNADDGQEAKFTLSSDLDDWIHADQLSSGVKIKFKTNQNAIMRLNFDEVCPCPCPQYNSDCCSEDSILFQNDEEYKEQVPRNRLRTDDCYFYVKEGTEAIVTYEGNCVKDTCALHLVRMKEFNFTKGNFKVDILEVNRQPISSPCYTFIHNLFFTPV